MKNTLLEIRISAENNVTDKPEYSIIQCGKFLEMLVKEICKIENVEISTEESFYNLTKLLKSNNLIPRDIYSKINKVRINRNDAAHENKSQSLKEAQIMLEITKEVEQWYINKYESPVFHNTSNSFVYKNHGKEKDNQTYNSNDSDYCNTNQNIYNNTESSQSTNHPHQTSKKPYYTCSSDKPRNNKSSKTHGFFFRIICIVIIVILLRITGIVAPIVGNILGIIFTPVGLIILGIIVLLFFFVFN